MSKIKQTKIPVFIDENMLKIAIDQYLIETEFNWKLIRENDGLTKKSNDVKWIEFSNDNRFKDQYEEPEIGRSLLMSPFNEFFTWQTTPITEIIEQHKGYIKFKTENSIYELYYIKNETTIE